MDNSWKKQVQLKDENVKDDDDSDDEIEVVGMKTNEKTFFAIKDEIKEEEKKRGLFVSEIFLFKINFAYDFTNFFTPP